MDTTSSGRVHGGTHVTSRFPWSVDRWGRLIAGASILCCMLLGLFVHPWWLWGSMLAAINLIATSLTNRCPMHALLMYLGATEREDLYWPGGRPRNQHRSEEVERTPLNYGALRDQPTYALINKLNKLEKESAPAPERTHAGERI